MSEIKTVAVAGATGNLGPKIVDALLKSGKFTVTVLKRAGSTATVPAGVKTIDVDYTSPESVEQALAGQDAVVCSLNPVADAAQRALLDGAIKVGVKRFLPAEFGSDMANPRFRNLPVFGFKLQMEQYVEEKTAGTDTSYSYVTNGVFLDWGLETGFVIDPAKKAATVYDHGDTKFSTTRLATVGQAVAGVLAHPDETKNRVVAVYEAITTQRELIALAQKAKPGLEFAITDLDSKQVLAKSYAAVAAGDYSLPVMYDFIRAAGFGANDTPDFGGPNDNELLGIKQLSEQELQAVVAEYIK
jgi:uncharacterized protein YbjT (DUF2867 family)